MNILFLMTLSDYCTSKKPLFGQYQINLGISYMSSILKQNGHSTDLFVVTPETKKIELFSFIDIFNPNLICFSSVTSEFEKVSELAKTIKLSYPTVFLLLGGPHPTMFPNCIKDTYFDAICIGEGEYPALELVEKLEVQQNLHSIKNIWFRKNNIIYKNELRPFPDINYFPLPDREIWQKWIMCRETTPSILISRGCPHKCTYCSNHIFKKLGSGNYTRFRNTDSIISELLDIKKRYPKTKSVYLETETIGSNMRFAFELCSKLQKIKNLNLSFGVNLRILSGQNYDTLFANFKAASINYINIGLESGSTKIRENILERYYSNEDIIKTTKDAKKNGLKIYFYVMMGLPEESIDDFKKTVDCCRKCQPDYIYLSFYYPYPNTKLAIKAEKHFMKKKSSFSNERTYPLVNSPSFSKEDMMKQYIWFFYNVYKGHKPLYVTLAYTLFQKITTNQKLMKKYRQLTSFKFIHTIAQKVANLENI